MNENLTEINNGAKELSNNFELKIEPKIGTKELQEIMSILKEGRCEPECLQSFRDLVDYSILVPNRDYRFHAIYILRKYYIPKGSRNHAYSRIYDIICKDVDAAKFGLYDKMNEHYSPEETKEISKEQKIKKFRDEMSKLN